MFKATLKEPSVFVDSILTIGELIDEAVFKLRKDGISMMATDRAMVAAVDFNLSSSAFDKYEIENDQSIGLNVTNMLSVLKRVKGDDSLTLELKGNKLEFVLDGGSKRKFVVPLIDLSEGELPQTDQLEKQYTSKVTMKPEELQKGLDDAEVITDNVMLEASGNKFTMRAEGDLNKAELELEMGKNDSLLEIMATGNVKSRYPLDYLKKMMKAGKMVDSVVLKFATDFPMKLEFNNEDKSRLHFVIAPRVSDN